MGVLYFECLVRYQNVQHFCLFLLESVTQKNDGYSSPDDNEWTCGLLRCTKTKTNPQMYREEVERRKI